VIVAASIAEALSPGNALVPEVAGEDDVEIVTWRFAERGAVTSAPQYLRALWTRRIIGDRLAAFFADYDVLLTPTMAQPPPRLGVVSGQRDDFEGFSRSVQPYVTFTQMFNMSGQPAASLPLHWTPEGLPVGVQIAAPLGAEARLLALAAQYEAACPWFGRRPPL
jgi:amidase/6-aminohexanoate-cyclic-dimer hydrolase